MTNAISNTRISEFRAFIESETASRRNDEEHYVKGSINRFKAAEMLLNAANMDEKAWRGALAAKGVSRYVGDLVNKLRLNGFQSIIRWVVRTNELTQMLVMLHSGKRSSVEFADRTGRRYGPVRIMCAMLAFMQACPDFPLASELRELLRIMNPQRTDEVFQKFLEFIRPEKRGGDSAAKPAETSSASGDVDALTARAEDLKNALECAQIQIASYEREIAGLREEMEDSVWLDVMAQMNSPAFGMLLDQFAAAEENLSRLRRDGFDIPKELESVAACVRLFMRAVRSFGVVPLREVGSALDIDLEQSEEFDYSGTEFENADNIITIRIVSPGWKYKETVFSRPRAVSAS